LLELKDKFELYENGKHRRYALLFSVNGGAFAVAKLLTGEPGKAGIVLGGLHLSQLSFGMILFTVVMIWDIFEFGRKMRKRYLPDAFGTQGKVVLLLLGALLCLGWFVVGFLSSW
jgi:NhaP-type Na+/H+ or K+/H+ antiporter